jgi:hypothetical protein
MIQVYMNFIFLSQPDHPSSCSPFQGPLVTLFYGSKIFKHIAKCTVAYIVKPGTLSFKRPTFFTLLYGRRGNHILHEHTALYLAANRCFIYIKKVRL